MVRYLIKFTKESEIKFISHLDLMRTIRRIIIRSHLPIKFSKGFNPHMALSLAQPLSVGVCSEGEYMDMILETDLEESEVLSGFNASTTPNIKFLAAKKIINIENEKKVPQAMALIDACRYTIKIKYKNTDNIKTEIENLLNKQTWITLKKSKKTEREVDIKSLTYEFKYSIEGDYLIFEVLLQSGSREHLSADTLISYIKQNTSNVDDEAFVFIKRLEMYFLKDNKLEPLYLCG